MMMMMIYIYAGHCHLGPFEIPRKDELEDCPLCGELYLEDHFIYDCVALRDIWVRWLDVGGRGIGDLRGLVWQRCSRLGTFLRVVCRVGAACSFGGLLVVGPSISPCGWVCSLSFHPWGVLGAFLRCWDIGHLPFGTMSDGVGRFPLLYIYRCLH